jgi:hypothetical protein
VHKLGRVGHPIDISRGSGCPCGGDGGVDVIVGGVDVFVDSVGVVVEGVGVVVGEGGV